MAIKMFSKKEYGKLVKKATPPSPIFKDCLFAFLSGGAICTFGQVLLRCYMLWGMSISEARTAVSVSLIFIAAVLTALGVFDKIGKFTGAGTLVPITGFANSMVSPAMEFRSEGLITGLGVKLFTVAGPVIAYGIIASWVYGLIYWVCTLF